MIPLRVIGILSNVAFMAYGFAGEIYPMLILHAILFPLNCVRLMQMRALIRKVRDAAQGDLTVEWQMPFMHRRRVAKGQALFKRGSRATCRSSGRASIGYRRGIHGESAR